MLKTRYLPVNEQGLWHEGMEPRTPAWKELSGDLAALAFRFDTVWIERFYRLA